MINYEDFDSAIGLNWYEIDPNLQQLMHRMLEPADLEWCEPELMKFGALCGGPIAARAEVSDRNPPELVKFDRWGEPLDEIVHHPSEPSPPSATFGTRDLAARGSARRRQGAAARTRPR